MGNVNIALNKSATAVNTVIPFEPGRATTTDLSPVQRWVASTVGGRNTQQTSITVDLAKMYFIGGYSISDMTACVGAQSTKWGNWTKPNYCNLSYKISFSADGQTFTDYETVPNPGGTCQNNNVTYPQTCRFVKITPTGIKINTSVASIAQIQVFDKPLLTSLSVAGYEFTSAFSPATLNYTTPVIPANINTVTLTASAPNDDYYISVNSGTPTSSQVSVPVTLSGDSTQISVSVISKIDGSHQTTYCVTVNRQNCNLAGLTLSDGKSPNDVALSPNFDPDATSYTANVGYDVNNTGNPSAQVTVTPTAANSSETITVNGSAVQSGQVSSPIAMSVGSGNIIKVISSIAGGSGKEYDVTVTMASSPYLAGIGNSTISFGKTTYEYSASTTGTGFIIHPTSDTDATISVTCSAWTRTVISGSGVSIPLSTGKNTFTVNTTSATGSDHRVYTFIITKNS